jgi:hypothetical protein
MYGEPLQPNRTKFEIGVFDGEISIAVFDLDELDNDDVREVVHPDFEKYWDNVMENCFVTEHFKTMQEAKDWCISIGMIFEGLNANSEIKEENQILSPYDKYSIQELNRMLRDSITKEEYEKSAEINAEIQKRNL